MPRRSRAAIQAAEQEELLRQALAQRMAEGTLRTAPKTYPEAPVDPSKAIAGFENLSMTSAAKYETVVYRDGSTSCNCPGWVFKRRDQPRECKHTRALAPHIADLVSGAAQAEKYGGVTPGTRKLMPAVQIRGDGFSMNAIDPTVLPTKRVRRDED